METKSKTPKLRAGDRVRVVEESYIRDDEGFWHCHKLGEEFTLKGRAQGGFWETVEGPGFYENEIDLVPSTSPIRTVTRREIVPGVYGSVSVERIPFEGFEIKYQGYGDSDNLREAAHLFNQLAEVLEENHKEST